MYEDSILNKVMDYLNKGFALNDYVKITPTLNESLVKQYMTQLDKANAQGKPASDEIFKSKEGRLAIKNLLFYDQMKRIGFDLRKNKNQPLAITEE